MPKNNTILIYGIIFRMSRGNHITQKKKEGTIRTDYFKGFKSVATDSQITSFNIKIIF